MDKFIVSARKYRPQNFNTVVGQSHITTTLKNAIKNQQLAHAFLFCGPRGVGKTTCARILAKTINCENQTPDGEACNTCNSCISFNEGISLNIHELDAASNNSVDDIRALVEQVRFAPQAGRYKVYIVDEVHMLSASAFNAFLKTLEEPPPYAIFILATTEKHKILPTILSRCQIFDFKRITNNDTVDHLLEIAGKEEIKAEKAALQVIAQKSEGCMRDSLSILDKIVSFTNGDVTYQNTLEHLNILDDDYYFRLLDTQLNEDMAGSILLYDEINRKGFEGDLVINGYAEFIRNVLVCQSPKAAALLEVVEGVQPKYIDTAKKVSPAYLISALNILNEAEINYKMARNKRLHVEMALIKLSFLQQAIQLSYDNETGTLIKKRRVNSPVAIKTEQVQSLHVKPATSKKVSGEAKLYVETPSYVTKVSEANPILQNRQTLKDMAKPAVEKVPVTVSSSADEEIAATAFKAPPAAKRSLLQNLRDKHVTTSATEVVKEAIPITEESLKSSWDCFIEKLKKEFKHAVVTVFTQAELKITNEHHFSIFVNTNLEQKFIEQEKLALLEYFKDCFQNRQIGFSIQINEQPGKENQEKVLSSREKYLKIVEQYPMVKELKDRLKLELDY